MSENKGYDAGFGSDFSKDPVRIVFITKKTSAKVKGTVREQVMSYPHVVLREAIAFQLLAIASSWLLFFGMLPSNSWPTLLSLRTRQKHRGIFWACRNCCTISRPSSPVF